MHGSTGGPDAATRAKARSRVIAIASDAAGATLATVRIEGASPYDFTAEMLAGAAIRAAGGGLRGAGALGPVDGFGLDELEADVAAAGIARSGLSGHAPAIRPGPAGLVEFSRDVADNSTRTASGRRPQPRPASDRTRRLRLA